jgi:signal transduction histidine kinase
MTTSGRAGAFEFLRGIPLFADLPVEDLERLSGVARRLQIAAGEELFHQGDPGDYAYVIEEGTIEISRFSDGREIPLATRGRGEVIGEMALLEELPRMATARAATPVVALAIGREQLDELLGSSPSAARAMVCTTMDRLRETEAALRQSEKMAQLGIFTAGLAHELNNPAAAVVRGAEQMRRALPVLLQGPAAVAHLGLSPAQFEELARRLNGGGGPAVSETALERSDREEAVERWLARRAIPGRDVLAAELVQAGCGEAELEAMAGVFSTAQLGGLLPLICASAALRSLLGEIGHGAREIANIVRAMKSYVYLDQGPVQQVDIHEGLEDTLVILRHKLKAGIEVVRDFAPDLPRVSAYGSELNQVWTNLIDNAADALEGRGRITLRTRRRDAWVIVEVQDDGPGIPEALRPRMFTLFFTTKPQGKGTGLGLSTAYKIVRRHGGSIDFRSEPGETVFAVRIPIEMPASAAGESKHGA